MLLVEFGSNPNEKDAGNATDLHYSALQGNDALAQLLLNHGADVDAVTIEEETALHFAGLAGQHEMC